MAFLAAHWRRWRWAFAFLLPMLAAHVAAQENVQGRTQAKIQDYQVEAVYLFNFTQFVEWPSAAFADAQKPIVIGVLGEDPFGAYLDETVRGEIVANRQLIIRRYRRIEDIDTCHVLFISRSEIDRLEPIISRLKDRNILTVSDADGFNHRGGMVHFVVQNDHVRLRINADAAKAAGLTVSSKLLRVAQSGLEKD